MGIPLLILGEHLIDERIEAQKVSGWRWQNEMVRLRVGGDFLLSLCLVVLGSRAGGGPGGGRERGDGETNRKAGGGRDPGQNPCQRPERGGRQWGFQVTAATPAVILPCMTAAQLS